MTCYNGQSLPKPLKLLWQKNCDYSNVQESMNNTYIHYIIQAYTNIFHSLSPCEYRTSDSHCQKFSLDHSPKKQSWQPRNSVNRLKRHKVMLTKINRFSIINTTAHKVQRLMKVWQSKNRNNKEKGQDEAKEMYFLQTYLVQMNNTVDATGCMSGEQPFQ